jgi:predicted nuclease with TOPRIM domain
MIDSLTTEQKEIVLEYQAIHSKLAALQDQMKDLNAEANELMEQLKRLREKDKKIFKNYGKK